MSGSIGTWLASVFSRLVVEDDDKRDKRDAANSEAAAPAASAAPAAPAPAPAAAVPATADVAPAAATPAQPPEQAKPVAPPSPLLIPSPDLEGIAQLIKEGKAKRIICMCGAGISVSAGIPDFRTPGTGLFSQMGKYGISRPEEVFSIDYFKENPEPFHQLAGELFPGKFKPTPTHLLMRLFHDKGLLLRCFTQNIDSLETQAGLPADAVVAAHGNFDGASCIRCDKPYPTSYFKDAIDQGEICRCESCKGLVKPDIVFYGENLPPRFFSLITQDFPDCDLLIVLGTSLVVYPFASLAGMVRSRVPRLLINRELVGDFNTDPETNRRDAVFLGNCDDAARQLAQLLGWQAELDALVAGA